jgi:hypothetical protein
VKALPETVRDLVPPLDPDGVADWLDRAGPKLAPQAFAAGTQRAAATLPTVKYPEEAFEMARQQASDKTEDGLKRWIAGVWLQTKAGKAWAASRTP